jgi:hypothetical protein
MSPWVVGEEPESLVWGEEEHRAEVAAVEREHGASPVLGGQGDAAWCQLKVAAAAGPGCSAPPAGIHVCSWQA